MKKKKIIIIISIILAILIAFAVAVIVKFNKEAEVGGGTYGSLNIMEDNSKLTSNYSDYSFTSLKEYMEFSFDGQLNVLEGTVNLKYCIGDEIIFEETYGPGTYEPKTDTYSGYDDELWIILDPSDDVQGSYDLQVTCKYKKFHQYFE